MKSRLLGVVYAWFIVIAFGNSAFAGSIYWTTPNSIQVAEQDGTGVSDVITGLTAPWGIAASNSNLFWTDVWDENIKRSTLGGADIQTLLGDFGNPFGIALDVTASDMYWANNVSSAIWRADFNGGSKTALVSGLADPIDVALDLTNGKMYWTNAGSHDIRRANLDGTGLEVVVTSIGSFLFGGSIALDPAAGKMYWASNSLDTIFRANLDGSSVETLIDTGRDFGSGVDIQLDLVAGLMYWSERIPGSISRSNLDGSNIQTVLSGLDGPKSISLVGSTSMVPIPATVWLFTSGLLGLIGVAKKRKAT